MKKHLMQLDTDILAQILVLLPLPCIARCALVCSSWRSAAGIALEAAYKISRNKYATSVKNSKLLSAVAMEQYLRFEAPPSSSVNWQAHSGRINCSDWIMDTFATGAASGTIRLWSLQSQRCIEEYVSPSGSVEAMHFDETKVLGASDLYIYLWKRKNKKIARKFGGHQRIRSMCQIDPEVAAGCADGSIRLFDLYSGQCSVVLRQHMSPVSCLAYSTSLHLLASAAAECNVRLCDTRTGEICASYAPKYLSPIPCLEMLEDESKIVAGTFQGGVYCWDVRSNKQPLWQHYLSSEVTSIHHREYGPVLVEGRYNGTLILSDGRDGGSTNVFKKQGSPVLSVKIGNSRVVCCHANGNVTCMDFNL